MKRREFINTGFGIALSTLFPLRSVFSASVPPASRRRRYLVTADAVTPGMPYEDRVNRINPDQPGFLSTWDIDSGKLRHFPIPIFPHVFTQHPVNPEVAAGAAKWNPAAVVVNLRTGEVLKSIRAPDTYRFFGHCGFSADGELIYISAHSDEENLGGLCVYETKNWNFKYILNGGCRQPHEFIFTPRGTILLAGKTLTSHPDMVQPTNNGICTEISLATKTVVRSYDIPEAAHLHFLDADRVVLTGGSPVTTPTLVVLSLKNGEVLHSRDSKYYPQAERLSEALSIAVLSEHEIAVSLIDAGELWLWNTKTSKMRVLKVGRKPRAMVLAPEGVFFSQGDMLSRYNFTRETFEKPQRIEIGAHIGSGSHMRMMWF